MNRLVLAASAAILASAPALAQGKSNIAWGGSNPGGVMYYMVGVAGTLISKELPAYNITQVTTGGSTENAKRLIKGELEMGIVYGAHVYMSLHKEGPFKSTAKGSMLRGVAKAYAGPTYFVALPGSGIKTLADLKGKTVAMGPPGSGTVFNCQNMMRALGHLGGIKQRYMTFADAGRAVGNGQVQALCQSSAPAAAVKELAETKGAVVIPYSDADLAAIQKKYPFYALDTMPASTYKGVAATKLPYLTVYWVAHERVAAKAIQDILELVNKPDNRKKLAAGHKAWGQMKPDVKNFLALGAPMHPGAEAYYKSKGQWPK